MFTGITLFLILAMVAYLVIFPLVRQERKNYDALLADLDADLHEDTLEKKKEAVFTTINEIEFDYKMKKLSEADYNQLKEQYKQKALELLHEEDEIELETAGVPVRTKAKAEAELEEEIERELAALRRQRSTTKQS